MNEAVLSDVGELDRRTYLGGGDVAAVLGIGATYDGVQQTPLTVYLKKTGETPEMDDGKKLFLTRRKRFEQPIVDMLREEFGGNIIGMNRRYRDPEFDFLASEIDWEWKDDAGETNNGETKTVHVFAYNEKQGWGEPGTSDYPVHYVAQNMFGLGITGRNRCTLAAMVGIDAMLFYEIQRDDEVIAQMRARCVDFWTNNVIARVPPDPVNLEDSMLLAQRMQGRPVVVDDDIRDMIENVRALRANRKAQEDDEKVMKFEILEHIRKKWQLPADMEVDENALLMHNGRKIGSFNRQVADRIDVERLRKEQKQIAREYTKESVSRVLRITKP